MRKTFWGREESVQVLESLKRHAGLGGEQCGSAGTEAQFRPGYEGPGQTAVQQEAENPLRW